MTVDEDLIAVPAWQTAIREQCYLPSAEFKAFDRTELEQSNPDRFEAIARQFPDRLAVKTQRHELRYAELNRAANRVASAILQECGAAPEPVALLFEHGASMITAILACLKAGKFYVPLDPAFPGVRAAEFVDDSQARLVLTNDANSELARAILTVSGTALNTDRLVPGLSADNPGICVSPDQLAYLVYTTGSTGRPKGVENTHRNVLHFIMNYTNAIHICAGDRMTLLRSFSVFGAVRDTFSALLNGAALFPFDVKSEGVNRLAGWLAGNRLTIAFFSPALLRSFAGILTQNDAFPELRVIRLGSETVRASDVELCRKHFPADCIIVNGLSSSETGTIAKYFMDTRTPVRSSTVPVGYPLEDMEVLLVDENGRSIEVGEVGEIAIRSRYLPRQFRGTPERTKQRYEDEFSARDERVVRTGDLGMRKRDGCLEFLGRSDFQVKIRGFRVEPAEVEQALLTVDGVRETAVVARDGHGQEQSLVAYVVPADTVAPELSDMHQALRRVLPDYMIPSAFVMLRSLPLNANGKLDRARLPDPQSAYPELKRPYVSPRNQVEAELARIWSEVLDFDRIGVHDAFLEIGGHSLLAGQIVARVTETFGVELPVRSLFESPTVAEMASVIVEDLPATTQADEAPSSFPSK